MAATEQSINREQQVEIDLKSLTSLLDAGLALTSLRETIIELMTGAYYKGALMGLNAGCESSDRVIKVQEKLLAQYQSDYAAAAKRLQGK